MLEKTLKFFYFLKQPNGLNLSCAQKRRMSKLGLLALGSWDQFSEIFLEEAAQLNHNNEQLFASWSILNNETF